jgi:hypothetical protein
MNVCLSALRGHRGFHGRRLQGDIAKQAGHVDEKMLHEVYDRAGEEASMRSHAMRQEHRAKKA